MTEKNLSRRKFLRYAATGSIALTLPSILSNCSFAKKKPNITSIGSPVLKRGTNASIKGNDNISISYIRISHCNWGNIGSIPILEKL